ncbi:MAG: ubiquitin-like protein [Flavobacterium sp.]
MKKTLQFYCVILFVLNSFHAFSMNLFVQTPNNGTISLDVEPSDSGENIKNKIFDQIAVPTANQVLTWNGTTIQDGQTLADYGITNNQTIQLTDTSQLNPVSSSFRIGNTTNLTTSGNVSINYNGGTLTNNGTLTNTNGSLAFTAPVTFEGMGTTTTNNLRIQHAGTSQLNNRIQVRGNVQVNNGNLDANNNLTLLSNASGSAVIAPVAAGSNITGKVTVQRFIPQGKRAFRFLTPGVTTDDFIANNWQLATHITGSTSGANGFDQTVSGNPSMFVYNNQQATGSGWAPIANTDATNLQVGHGYRLLVRGDRTPSNITAASLPIMNTAVTLAATGTVAVGTVTLNASSTPAINNTTNTTTDGFSLIGNPYVNTVNWNDLTKTGLTDAYYAWDANMGTLAQRGRYVVFSTALGTNNMASAVNEFIQPGQAFFVKNTALGTAGSITFNEANKVGGSSISNQVFATPATLSRIDLQVFETNELALNGYPIDAAVAVFSDAFSNDNEGLDIEKLSTGTENIAFKNQNKNFAIETRALVTPTDELQIDLNEFVANKNYSFKTIFSDFDTNATPYLVDTYLNEVTALNNNQATIHHFQTNNEAASFANNRFKIVFQNTTLSNPTFTEAQVVLYPNPVTNNRFQLRLPVQTTGTVGVRVSNTLGQVVYQATHTADAEISIQMNQTLQEGIYMVQLENQGFSVTKKITVKR